MKGTKAHLNREGGVQGLGGPQTTHLDCMEEVLPISVTCPGLEQCCESTWPEPHVMPKAGEAGLGVDPKGCQRRGRQGEAGLSVTAVVTFA